MKPVLRSGTILALALIFAAGTVHAQVTAFPDVPELTVSLEPAGTATAGGALHGQILLKLQLASRHPFEALTVDLDLPDGVSSVTLTRPRTRKTRSYAGEGHVHEMALALFPERSGMLTIPPARAVGAVRDDSGRNIPFDARGPAFSFPVSGIDPDFGDGWWMVSSRVDIDETWSKPVDQIRVDDIVRREVVVTAFGVVGHRVAVPEHRTTRGVLVADAGAEISTETAATGVIGRVRQAWNIKMEQGGVVYVPPVSVAYWHPQEHRTMKAATPGYRLEPRPADREAMVQSLMQAAQADHDGRHTVALVVVVILLAPFLALGLILAWLALPTQADRRLRRRCAAAATPAEAYRAVAAWSAANDLAPPGCAAARPGPSIAADALVTAVFGSDPATGQARETARDLIRYSRRARLQRCFAVLSRCWIAVAGPEHRL